MSYAVQCLQESVIAIGGYADESEICKKINIKYSYIFEAFFDLISNKFISEEFYENKGHKVLARFIKNTNAFEIDPDVKNDDYDDSYLLTYKETIFIESEAIEHTFVAKKEIFVGSLLGARKHALKMKEILLLDEDAKKITYSIRKRHKTKY